MTIVASLSATQARLHVLSGPREQRNFNLPLDYSRKVSRVFVDLATWVIRTQQSLALLLLIADFGRTVEGERIPSWCPNWNRDYYRGGYLGDYPTDNRFEKGDIRIEADMLYVRAMEVGIIKTVQDDGSRTHAYVEAHSSLRERELCEWDAFGAVHSGDTVVHVPEPWLRCDRLLVLRKKYDETFAFKGALREPFGHAFGPRVGISTLVEFTRADKHIMGHVESREIRNV